MEAADVEPRWPRGIGSPMLPRVVDALLAHRLTVLDVSGHIARATALRAAVDTMLRHPQAAQR